MQFRTILVPVDFSACSAGLVASAVDMAKTHGATLHLVHVIEPIQGLSSSVRVATDEGSMSIADALRAEAQRNLDAYETGDVPTERSYREGHPVDGVLGAIEEVSADLVMLGTHGRRGLAHLLLGSVAERVVRQSPVPVMTLRTMHHAGCDAASCNWCSNKTAMRAQAEVEADG